jgi:hypothetical protein
MTWPKIRSAILGGIQIASSLPEVQMAAKTPTVATQDRRKKGQGVPLGDTGERDTAVRKHEQGISNRPGDEDANEQNRDDEEDEG